MITTIFVWSFLSYGLMNILVYGSIFKGLRENMELWGKSTLPFSSLGEFISGILSCPMCFGFHGGWFLSAAIFSPIHALYGTSYWIAWFFDAIFSSGIVWTINAVVEWFEESKNK